MTMPNERAKAELWGRAFLKEVLQSDDVPEKLRKDARHILRHYPLALDVQIAALEAPDLFEVDDSPVMQRALKDAGNSDFY